MSTTGAPMLSPESPWPGLRPFGEDDRRFFFGRERETAELLALVQRSVVVVVYGQSGLGKTSLLQAGLFHGLREVSLLPFRLRIDHSDAAASASTQIKAALTAALDAAGVQGPRPGPDETLWEYFHRHDVDLWGARNRLIRPVIAFDQFEEVFTLGQRSEKAIARVAGLAADLESLLEHRAPESVRARLEQRPDDALKYDFQQEGVKFVISLREDFLAQLDTWRTRMPSLLPNRFRLERMTGAQALDVVQRAGAELVDAAIAKEIVDFVSRSQRRAQTGALQARNVEPALLSVVCDELNRRRLNRKQAQITPDLLSGEREGIIAGFYARAFEDVEPRARDWVEEELLTASGYRDRAAQEDALRSGVREADLDKLVDRRILHREERDGVVWLELTHDLLTDPAYASHTQREQRRVAEEATRREADTAARLRRTTRLAAGFAVLSLAMVVAMIYALSMSKRAADAQASMQKTLDISVGLKKQADSAAERALESAKKAQAEADRASSSFSTAMGMAEPLGQMLREFVLGDMRLLTPAVVEIVARTDESYRLLESQDAAAASEAHAAFLMTAAEALYDVGHLTDGVTRAEQAASMLDAHPPADAAGRALRAEAVYARGAGYAATGRMGQARRDLGQAISLAATEAKASGWTPDLARINVLSEIGLGELDRWALALPSAESHYQHVLTFLTGRTVPGYEEAAATWRELALIGMGVSSSDPTEQDRRFAKAESSLQQLVSADPDSLRLLRLTVELGMLRGRTAIDLGRPRQAAKFVADADGAGSHLMQHDRDNLQWKLVWARTQRSRGYLDQYNKDAAGTRAALEPADRAVLDLLKVEPTWRQARYTHGAILYEIAQAYRMQNLSDRALALMSQSRDEFVADVKRAPGDLEFVRGVTLTLGGLASAHFDRKEYDETIQFAKQALAALAPAEKLAPNNDAVQTNKAFYYGQEALGFQALSNWKESIDAYANRATILRSLALRTRLASDETTLAGAFVDLGDAWKRSGDNANAATQYDLAADAITRALAVDSLDPSTVHEAFVVRGRKISTMTRQSDVPVMLDNLQTAGTLVWTALQHEAWNPTLLQDIGAINQSLNYFKTNIGSLGLPAADVPSLTARAEKALADHQPSTLVDWVMRPLMPGPWTNLIGDKLSAARVLVLQAYPRLHPDQVFAIRTMPLSFRKNNDLLYEAGVEADNGDRGIVAFVDKGPSAQATGRFAVLDGTSAAVYQMNSESPPLLDTPEHAAAYLRFFLGMWHADLGPNVIIERPDDVPWLPDAPDDLRASVGRNLQVLRPVKQADGSWASPGTLIYGATLETGRVVITANGGFRVDNDVRLMRELPVWNESITDGVKFLREIRDVYAQHLARALKQLESAPADPKILSDAADLHFRLKHWRDAVSVQQQAVDALRANPATTKADQVSGYVSLSWYQLFIRDFGGALASTDAGRKIDETDIYLDTNRAHALLFLGRTPEADALYRSRLGQKMSPTSGMTWNLAILEDFADLEKASVTSPDVARIRKMMGGS